TTTTTTAATSPVVEVSTATPVNGTPAQQTRGLPSPLPPLPPIISGPVVESANPSETPSADTSVVPSREQSVPTTPKAIMRSDVAIALASIEVAGEGTMIMTDIAKTQTPNTDLPPHTPTERERPKNKARSMTAAAEAAAKAVAAASLAVNISMDVA